MIHENIDGGSGQHRFGKRQIQIPENTEPAAPVNFCRLAQISGDPQEELAHQKAYRQLTMTTEEGMAHFVAFIQDFQKTGNDKGAVDLTHLREEQERIGRWARDHAAQLVAAGAQEQWNRASCIAVPSDDPMGYDFIAMKEVKV